MAVTICPDPNYMRKQQGQAFRGWRRRGGVLRWPTCGPWSQAQGAPPAVSCSRVRAAQVAEVRRDARPRPAMGEAAVVSALHTKGGRSLAQLLAQLADSPSPSCRRASPKPPGKPRRPSSASASVERKLDGRGRQGGVAAGRGQAVAGSASSPPAQRSGMPAEEPWVRCVGIAAWRVPPARPKMQGFRQLKPYACQPWPAFPSSAVQKVRRAWATQNQSLQGPGREAADQSGACGGRASPAGLRRDVAAVAANRRQDLRRRGPVGHLESDVALARSRLQGWWQDRTQGVGDSAAVTV